MEKDPASVLVMMMKMGVAERDICLVNKNNQENPVIKDGFQGRLQFSGIFPNLDVHITDLALNDTGPYWCLYQRYNYIKKQTEIVKAQGSVLVVVSGKTSSIYNRADFSFNKICQ